MSLGKLKMILAALQCSLSFIGFQWNPSKSQNAESLVSGVSSLENFPEGSATFFLSFVLYDPNHGCMWGIRRWAKCFIHLPASRSKATCLSTLCLLVCFEIDLFCHLKTKNLRTEVVLYSLRFFTFSWKNLFHYPREHSFLFFCSLYIFSRVHDVLTVKLWDERGENSCVIFEKKAGSYFFQEKKHKPQRKKTTIKNKPTWKESHLDNKKTAQQSEKIYIYIFWASSKLTIFFRPLTEALWNKTTVPQNPFLPVDWPWEKNTLGKGKRKIFGPRLDLNPRPLYLIAN